MRRSRNNSKMKFNIRFRNSCRSNKKNKLKTKTKNLQGMKRQIIIIIIIQIQSTIVIKKMRILLVINLIKFRTLFNNSKLRKKLVKSNNKKIKI